MFRPIIVSLMALLLSSVAVVSAAPLQTRQIGDLQCNIDRASIVVNLAETIAAVNAVSTAGGSDTSVKTAASNAKSGLSSAEGGIATIAGALLTGQAAPAAARDQVQQGLTAAGTALSSIKSTSSTVTTAVKKAQGLLAKAQTAGNGVVANCK